MEISHLHKYSDPLLSTLLKHQAWHTCIWGISTFFSADPVKVCQVGWGGLLHSYFRVSPQMFDQVHVRALAGPLKDIQRLVSKSFLLCLGWVLRVVVLFEGEPSPQFEVLGDLELFFINDLSALCFVNLSLDPD
jgi:hypothetical protein